jgi:hypothetical protein
MEFNSVFLHARKLLKFYGFHSSSPVVLANSALNMVTFVAFRFGTIALIFAGVYHDGHRVTRNYLLMLVTCVVLMAIINVVLFKRILVKDLVPLMRGLSRLLLCSARHSHSSATSHEQSERDRSSRHDEDEQVKLLTNESAPNEHHKSPPPPPQHQHQSMEYVEMMLTNNGNNLMVMKKLI